MNDLSETEGTSTPLSGRNNSLRSLSGVEVSRINASGLSEIDALHGQLHQFRRPISVTTTVDVQSLFDVQLIGTVVQLAADVDSSTPEE